jgi:hypothetical protein
MTQVQITNPDGSVEAYETTCPLFVYVETSDPFQDPGHMDDVYMEY